MYLSRIYHQSIKALVLSLRIKLNFIAKAFNDYDRLSGYYVDDTRPDTWRYYLNLAGKYHARNKPMTVVSLDTLESIPFTVESLQVHKATAKAYTLDSEYYNDLVTLYPDNRFLIEGIIAPVDIQTAIKARDYTILKYDTSLVEPQEINLIPDLQDAIYRFYHVHYNRDFAISNDLTPHAFYGIIATLLAPMIETLRLEKTHTNEAHSYHIWNYLDSFGRLKDYKPYLTTYQVLWLYRNIRYVMKNVGKNDTFDRVMDAILTHRGIPLAKYSTDLKVDKVTENLKCEPFLWRTPLNMLNVVPPAPITRTLSYVYDAQENLAPNNVKVKTESLAYATTRLPIDRMSQLPTKVYESAMTDTKDLHPMSLTDILFLHWGYLAAESRYIAKIPVTNPQTGNVLNMSMLEAFAVWVYVANKANNVNLPVVPEVTFEGVRKLAVPSSADIHAKLDKTLIAKSQVDYLQDTVGPIGVIRTTDDFWAIGYELYEAYVKQRVAVSSQTNYLKRGHMAVTVDQFYTTATTTLTQPRPLQPARNLSAAVNTAPVSYDDYLQSKGWAQLKDLDSEAATIMATQILAKATGADTQDSRSIKEIQSAMLRLTAQLNTYATQFIQTINDTPLVVTDTKAIRLAVTSERVRSYASNQLLPADIIKASLRGHQTTKLTVQLPTLKANMRQGSKAVLDFSLDNINAGKDRVVVRSLASRVFASATIRDDVAVLP